MWLHRGSPGLLWKHLPLISHGVKGLMNTAPCILTNATFHLVLPLCSQKDVWHRTSKKKKKIHIFVWYSSQICPQSQHSLLAQHHTSAWGGQLRHHRAQLDNIIVEQQDPHTAHGQDLYDSVNHATSEPYNIKKSSFVTSIFSGAAKTSLSLYCMSHGLNVAILS